MKSFKVLALCAAVICSLVSCSSGKKEYRNYFKELGYSQEEIAEKKGVSQNTISKKLRRIQKTLTEMCRKEI